MKYLKINILSLCNLFLLVLITFLNLLSGLMRAIAKIGIYFIGFCLVYWISVFIMNFNINSIFESVGTIFSLIGVVIFLGGYAVLFLSLCLFILILSFISLLICSLVWDNVSNFISEIINVITGLLMNLYIKNYNKIISDNNYKCIFGSEYKMEIDEYGVTVAHERLTAKEKKSSLVDNCIVNIVAVLEIIMHKLLNRKETFGIIMVCLFLIGLIVYQNYLTITCFDMLYIKYLSYFEINDVLAALVLVTYIAICLFIITKDITGEMDDFKSFLDVLLKREVITLE